MFELRVTLERSLLIGHPSLATCHTILHCMALQASALRCVIALIYRRSETGSHNISTSHGWALVLCRHVSDHLTVHSVYASQ
jgi:hypothetical protein